MKTIAALCLAVLLPAAGSSLAFAAEEVPSQVAGDITQEETSGNVADVVKEEPVITKADIKSAKTTPGALIIELRDPEEFLEKWEKYVYFDVDQDLNTNSQTYWTRLGTRKGPFDISVGWNQKFNQLATEDTDKGMLNLSMSYWW